MKTMIVNPVIYRKRKIALNPVLLEKQGINKQGEERILDLHRRKIDLFIALEKIPVSEKYTVEEIAEIRKLDEALHETEFETQEAWGFERDRNRHRWWLYNPHCTCSTMDNKDRLGIEGIWMDDHCPVHGTKFPLKKS